MSAQVERDDTGWQWFCGDCGDWSTYYTFEDDALADAADHDGRWHADDGTDTYVDRWKEEHRG